MAEQLSANNKPLVIFFSDIVGSTSMYERLGDQRAQLLVSECLEVMISTVTQSGGTLIKTVGDEVMASFVCSDAALQAAVDIQMALRNQVINVRIGFHYGFVIEDNGDYFGNAVNIAARIASRARANEIMTTEQTVLQLSEANRNSIRFLSASRVKGKEELLSIYEVLWDTDAEDDLTMTAKISSAIAEDQVDELELIYQGRTFQINSANTSLTIGRSNENNLIVNHELVSRRHAKIELINSRFILTDTSSNGTIVEFDRNQPILIVRDTIELLGNGEIDLGAYKKEDVDNSIKFRRINNKFLK